MIETNRLAKVLTIREHEEKDAQLAHAQSVSSFEKLAKNLYNLLKKKEKMEELYNEAMKRTTAVHQLREKADYMKQLNQEIIALQEKVNQARKDMKNKREALTSAHIEVKKIENIIDQRLLRHKKYLLKTEQEQLDEVSSQQYINQKLGE